MDLYPEQFVDLNSLSWVFQARNDPVSVPKSWLRREEGGFGESDLFRLDVLLDCHVFKFTGLEDIAAFLAFNKFGAFVAGHNAYTRMPAEFLHKSLIGGSLRER
jgi:hypothetical protein